MTIRAEAGAMQFEDEGSVCDIRNAGSPYRLRKARKWILSGLQKEHSSEDTFELSLLKLILDL
jgi:hypothetical protein